MGGNHWDVIRSAALCCWRICWEKDGFFIWQQRFSISARFTALYTENSVAETYRTATDTERNMTKTQRRSATLLALIIDVWTVILAVSFVCASGGNHKVTIFHPTSKLVLVVAAIKHTYTSKTRKEKKNRASQIKGDNSLVWVAALHSRQQQHLFNVEE